MKKFIFFFAIFSTSISIVNAQVDSTSVNKNNKVQTNQQNFLEISLTSLPLRNFNLDYQRRITRKTSVGLVARLMPNGPIPFEQTIRSNISDSTTKSQINNVRVGDFAIMPEIRFYFGHRGAFHGFYLALFGNLGHYSISLPYNYTDSNNVNQTIQMSGKMNTITGGFMLGAQWSIGKVVSIDLHILGPNYGSAKGSISGTGSLSSSDQSSLQSSLNDLKIPLVTTTSTVNANGAKLNFSGPWAGIRSGISVGVRF
jgi:Protein of unknown function (DUF3575)